MEHPHQQYYQSLLAGRDTQYAAIGQPFRLIHPLFQKGIRLAYGAAAAIAQSLLDFLPLEMILHLPGLRVGIKFHGTVRLNPGKAVVLRVQVLQKAQSRLFRSGGGNTQLIL